MLNYELIQHLFAQSLPRPEIICLVETFAGDSELLVSNAEVLFTSSESPGKTPIKFYVRASGDSEQTKL